MTIVVAGAVATQSSSAPDDLRARVAELEAGGVTRKDAIAQAAQEAGVPRREVYNLVHQ